MALNVCAGCTTKFAVGLRKCPQCGSSEFQEDGVMPKITNHGGASIAGASVTGGQWGDPDETPTPDALPEEEGGEDVSPGNSSETSTETPPSGPEQSAKPTRSPARKTASRSKKAPTESPSAPSTDGDQAADTSAADE
jgi:hypothetical protein